MSGPKVGKPSGRPTGKARVPLAPIPGAFTKAENAVIERMVKESRLASDDAKRVLAENIVTAARVIRSLRRREAGDGDPLRSDETRGMAQLQGVMLKQLTALDFGTTPEEDPFDLSKYSAPAKDAPKPPTPQPDALDKLLQE